MYAAFIGAVVIFTAFTESVNAQRRSCSSAKKTKGAQMIRNKIDISSNSFETIVYGKLPKIDDYFEVSISTVKGARLRAEIAQADGDGNEGAIMVGEVFFENGESDGQPGGLFFDDVLSQSGRIRIRVKQNGAKSQAKNVNFKLIIKYEIP